MKEHPLNKMKWLVTVGVAAAVAVTGCSSNSAPVASPGATSDSANGNVAIMVDGLNKHIYLPFMLAQQLGYYKEQGLTVTLTNVAAGVDSATNLLAGKIDGVGGSYDHTIDLAGLGQQVESVVSMLTIPGEVELCRTDLKNQIKSPADWSGRNLGVTGLGSGTDFLTQYMAKKNGVDPTTIHRLGVQAGATVIGAIQHKNVDCAMTTEPTVSQLLATGDAYILVDMRTAAGTSKALGGDYPFTSLYMKTSYVKQNPVTVQKLVNAYVKTLKFIQDHSAAEIAAKMPKDYYAGVGLDSYVKALDGEKGIYNPTGIMPPNGPPLVLKVLSLFNKDVQGKTIDVKTTYTDEFVKAAK